MEGAPEPPELRGIIPNAFLHIFDKVALAKAGQQFLVRASYLEIYNEEVGPSAPVRCGLFGCSGGTNAQHHRCGTCSRKIRRTA